MAITTEQVLSAVSEYREANGRPCPARYLTDKFGAEALDVIKTLKDNGSLVGKRGRTGGLVPSDTASTSTPATTEAESEAATEQSSGDSVADQFAALAAKLAAEDASIAVG